MGNGAASLLLAAGVAFSASNVWALDAKYSVGKTPEWEVWSVTPTTDAEVVTTLPEAVVDVAMASEEETPNQRRRRMGLPLEETFAPQEYGQALETPNQRRTRLKLPLEESTPMAEFGVREETPNQLRQRLATARIVFF